ncbi:Protein BOBBER 1 [Astathelohania contejeani]|uniref:Protein BOBBER 1 n=1 Tax=Astathelohania contejeani TaxID=164912 RepID=A0ABQ7HX58_9MICR|nr:Protein BOBBER 1 [Thelohania contejeani]
MNYNYTWNQDFDDVTIDIPLDELTKRNDISVKIVKKHLIVEVCGKEVFNNELFMDVYSGNLEYSWSLENGVISILMNKKKNMWWECAFVGHEKIDTEKLARDRPTNLDQWDEEGQRIVEEMLYNQKNKKENLQTDQEEILKKIMNSEENKDK